MQVSSSSSSSSSLNAPQVARALSDVVIYPVGILDVFNSGEIRRNDVNFYETIFITQNSEKLYLKQGFIFKPEMSVIVVMFSGSRSGGGLPILG